MHSFTITGVLAAIVALTAAAPHAGGHHQHHHHHLRSADLIAIAGRSIQNGACGGVSGDMCQPGYCCSQWGYCGKSDDYCGVGCNSAFGECSTNSSSSATASTVTVQSTIIISATPSSIVSSAIPSSIVSSATPSSSVSSATPSSSVSSATPSSSVISSASTKSAMSTVESTSLSTSTTLAGTSSAETSSAEMSIAEAGKFHPHPTYSPPEHSSTTEASAPTAPTSRVVLTTTFATLISSSSAVESSSEAQPTSALLPSSLPSSAAVTTTSTDSSATSPASDSWSSGSNSYKSYTGDGTASAGWPAQNAWVSFEGMWSANLRIISVSCTQFGQDNNSDEESANLKSAIQSIASSSGIDARFILAVVMQESKGCVRAPTTNYGVRNPGLMQDHDGTGTCNDASVLNPCPQSQIEQMIKDGTTGTAAGDGLEQCLTESGATDVSKYYKAARIYNSGSVTDNNLSLGVATHCYASDIANRLTGWVDAPTACTA